VLEHVGPRFRAHLIHSLATQISFPEREKIIPEIRLSLESVQVYFLKY